MKALPARFGIYPILDRLTGQVASVQALRSFVVPPLEIESISDGWTPQRTLLRFEFLQIGFVRKQKKQAEDSRRRCGDVDCEARSLESFSGSEGRN